MATVHNTALGPSELPSDRGGPFGFQDLGIFLPESLLELLEAHSAINHRCRSGGGGTQAVLPVTRGPALDLSLTYNSLAAAQGSPIGFGWSFSYGMHLVFDPGTGAITVVQENGATVPFALSSGSYQPPSYAIGSHLLPATLNEDLVATLNEDASSGL